MKSIFLVITFVSMIAVALAGCAPVATESMTTTTTGTTKTMAETTMATTTAGTTKMMDETTMATTKMTTSDYHARTIDDDLHGLDPCGGQSSHRQHTRSDYH